MQWTVQGTPVHSHVFMHDTTGTASTTDLTTLAGAVASGWATNLNQYQPSSFSLAKITVDDLGTPSTLPGIVTPNAAGGLSGSALTAETCVLINLIIGRRYRGGKPRLYWPLGASVDLNDPQHWTSSWVGLVQPKVNAFFANLLSAPYGAVTLDHIANVSYYSNKVLRPTPIWDPVLAYVVNLQPGSQRRRMGR